MIHVDAERCIGCGSCVPTCPLRDFFLEGDKARLVEPDKFVCIDCGHCVSVCPTDAVSMDGDTSVPIPPETGVFAQDLARLMMTRRSVRDFEPEPVSREDLMQALEVARYAPTARNLQEIMWLCLSDPGELKAVADLTAGWLLDNPASAHVGRAYFAGEDRVLRGAPTLLLCHAPEENLLSPQDCGAAISYLELLLHARGIGATWAGYVINAARQVPALRERLGLEPGRAVYGGLMLGYSRETYRRIPGRKPVRIVWK